MGRYRGIDRFPDDRPPQWPQRLMGMICAVFGAALAGSAWKGAASAGPLALIIVLWGLVLAVYGLRLTFGPVVRRKTAIIDAPPKRMWMRPWIIFVIFGLIFAVFGAITAGLIGLFGWIFVLVGLVFMGSGVRMLLWLKRSAEDERTALHREESRQAPAFDLDIPSPDSAVGRYNTLQQQLEQLEAQRKAGLYTEEEYRERRQKLLEEA